ncbi:tetratricopeptide repeat protein [Aneurinibacillus uraniidurans]|uniref:tetratricopeptide repeat protein n=1 Tax=Aneurinibacillus uraniidurans TaxID=2966586 RepID=UPI002349D8B1|nr:tetratricopeptide repeat protein [Aneurinibacillus sp. B1]WCN37957.1 tetratricopeptide repeat protein [Aneurinibacillus sp. B1]
MEVALAQRQQAYHYYEIGRYQQAKQLFFELLKDNPMDEDVMYCIAYCCFQLDEYETAIHHAERALECGLMSGRAHSLLGALHMHMQQYVEAEEWFLAALMIDPQDAAVLAQYAYLMLITGHEDKGEQLIAEAQRLESNNRIVLHYRYIFESVEGNEKERECVVQQYMEVGESEVDKLLKLADMAIDQENYREARECYRQAFVLDPTNSSVLKMLKQFDRMYHPIFLPIRVMERTGGWIAWSVGFIILMFIGPYIGLDRTIQGWIGIAYILLCIYTWIAGLLYWIWRKITGWVGR